MQNKLFFFLFSNIYSTVFTIILQAVPKRPGQLWFLSPAAWRKGDIVVTRVVRPSVHPAGWASTFIAVSAITHKLFAISI